MARNAVNYENVAAPAGTVATVQIGNESFTSLEGTGLAKPEFGSRRAALDKQLTASIRSHGYPAAAYLNQINYVMTTVMLFILVLYVTMVYGPIAAMLVEMFPTRIRYTSMRLPYHIDNGWFVGFLPPVAFAGGAATGNIYDGLWYPIIIVVDAGHRHAVRPRNQGQRHQCLIGSPVGWVRCACSALCPQ